MKAARLALGMAALIAVVMAPSAFASELPALLEKIRPGVVGVGTTYPPRQPNVRGERFAYLGTGFVVGNGRQIITNAHVAGVVLDTDNHQTLAVFSGHGAQAIAHPAREVRRDEEHDLALLEIQGDALPALQLGDSDTVKEGQDIAFTGFPIGMVLGLYPATHRGTIAAITPTAQPAQHANELNTLRISRKRSGFEAFQLDATAYPGNSGSPVFELTNGRVVAIINSVVVKETREAILSRPSGITYAVPANYIRPLLGTAPP